MKDPGANELVGQLTLADAMLGEVVADLREILAYANWPGTVRAPAPGATTGQAAEKLERELSDEAALASGALLRWIEQVREEAERRNRLVHAIALDQCMSCGDATMFRHPSSGEDVDRSPEGVTSVLARYDRLRADGLPLAIALSAAVNRRIFVEAKKIADATDEIQNPPQIYPHHVEHLCSVCSGDGGSTVVHGGTAIAVVPTARWEEYRDGLWPSQEATEI